MAVTHPTVVVVADDGTSPVGTNEWNADHATPTVSLSGASANKDQLLITDNTAGAGMTIGGDTNLYRSAANELKTDDKLVVTLGLDVLGDNIHLKADAGGGLYFGAAADNRITRVAAAKLRVVSGDLQGGNNVVADDPIWVLGDDGVFEWGPGGAAAPVDTNLYRSAANTLKTDDSLVVAGTIKQSTTKTVLDTDHTAAADPHPVYRLESEGESNVYIQDPGTFTIPTAGRLTQPVRLALSGTNRLTDAGTGRAALSDAPNDPSSLKYRVPGSDSLMPDEYVTEYQRVEMRGNSRRSMYGTGRSVVTGFAPVGSLVLSGRGGGS